MIIVVVIYCLKKNKQSQAVGSEDNVMIQPETAIPDNSGMMSIGQPASNEMMVEKMDA